MRTLRVSALLVLVAATAHAGQGASEQQAPGPEAVDSWEVHIDVRGGLLGTGSGDTTVDASGRLTCAPSTRCPDRLSPSAVERIAATVATLRTARWVPPQEPSLCSDCYVTTMTVRMQSTDGSEIVHVYSWSDVTFAAIPEDVRRTYRTIRDLTARPAAPRRAQFR